MDIGTGEIKSATNQSTAAADDLARLADDIKKLREAERQIVREPPAFVWSKRQGRAALEAEHKASCTRLHTGLSSKIDAAPALDKLGNIGMIDVAYSAAGL